MNITANAITANNVANAPAGPDIDSAMLLHWWHVLIPIGSILLGCMLIYYALRARTHVHRRLEFKIQWPGFTSKGVLDWLIFTFGLLFLVVLPYLVLFTSNEKFLHAKTPPTMFGEVLHRINQSMTIMIAITVTLFSIAVITGALRGFPTRAGRFWIGASVGVILIAGSILGPTIDRTELTKAVAAAFLTVALVMFLWVEGHIEDIKSHIYGMSKVSRAMSVLRSPDLKEEIGRLIDGMGSMLDVARNVSDRRSASTMMGAIEISARDQETMALAAIRDCADAVERLRYHNEVTIKKDAFTLTWDRLIETFNSYLSVCDLSMYNDLTTEAATRTSVEWKARIKREKAHIINSMSEMGNPVSLEQPLFDKVILYEPLESAEVAKTDAATGTAPCLAEPAEGFEPGRCSVGTCTTSYPCVVRSVVEAWLHNTQEEIEARKRSRDGEESTIFARTKSHFFPEEVAAMVMEEGQKVVDGEGEAATVTTRFWMIRKSKFRLVEGANTESEQTQVFRGLDNSDVGIFGEKFVGEELKFRTSAGDNGWQYNIRLDGQLAEIVRGYVKAKVVAFGWPLLPPKGDMASNSTSWRFPWSGRRT